MVWERLGLACSFQDRNSLYANSDLCSLLTSCNLHVGYFACELSDPRYLSTFNEICIRSVLVAKDYGAIIHTCETPWSVISDTRHRNGIWNRLLPKPKPKTESQSVPELDLSRLLVYIYMLEKQLFWLNLLNHRSKEPVWTVCTCWSVKSWPRPECVRHRTVSYFMY